MVKVPHTRFARATPLLLPLLACLLTQPVSAADGPDKAAPPKPAQDFYHSFKGDADVTPDFQYDGLDPQQCLQFEPTGLRITLPTGHPGRRMGTGLATTFGVTGDFEITMTYEILKEPANKDAGHATGVYLGATLDTPRLSRGILTRSVWTKSWVPPGKRFMTWYRLAGKEPDGPPKEDTKTFPAGASSGKLRLVRTGAVLYHYVAENAAEEFTLLQSHPFGTEDLKDVRVGGHTGGPKASLDARILDLRIRAGTLPGLPDEPDSDAAKDRGKGWLAAGLGIGLGAVLLTAAVIWLVRRRGRRPETPVPVAEETAAPIAFSCSGCGKGLKVKPELAGKKVKCPKCGASVSIPDSPPGADIDG